MNETLVQDEKEVLLEERKRLESLRQDLIRAKNIMRKEVEEFSKQKEAFEKRENAFRSEMDLREKQLSEDQKIFDKKFQILEMGFKQLEADRKAFESKKRAFEFKQKYENDAASDFTGFGQDELQVTADKLNFFRGVNNPLALKKRYKDLIKIYHPDNLAGDKSCLQQINREYEMLKKIINVTLRS